MAHTNVTAFFAKDLTFLDQTRYFATYCYSKFVFGTFILNYEENIAFTMILNTHSEKYQNVKKIYIMNFKSILYFLTV